MTYGETGYCSLGDGVLEDALLLLSVVKSECGLDVEVFDWIDVQVSVTEHTPVCVSVITIAIQSG